jgi:hypothetical protein
MRLYVVIVLFVLVAALLVPISASAQADVDCVAIVESDGTRVARATHLGSEDQTSFYLGHNGFAVPLILVNQAFVGSGNKNSGNPGDGKTIYFMDATCSTTPFIRVTIAGASSVLPRSAVIGREVYYSEPAVRQIAEFLSFISTDLGQSGNCEQIIQTEFAVSAPHNFTISQYTPPFIVEPEACYTPPSAVAALTPYSLAAMALVLAFSAYVMQTRRGFGPIGGYTIRRPPKA